MNPILAKAGMLLCALLVLPLPALAQTPSPLPEWTYSSGELLRTSLSPVVPQWSVVAGVSAEYVPRYDGAHDYHFLGGPMIDVRYRDLAFLSTGEGLGVNIFRGKKYRAGVALGYDLGRRAQDSDDTRGLGNVNVAPEAKVFGEYLWFPVVLRAEARRGLGGHDGWVSDLSAYLPVYGRHQVYVFLGSGVTFADDRYMAHYFGVTPAQSAASGYAPYAAHAGLKSVGLGGSATWMMSTHWLLNLLVGGQRFLGDAVESPLTQQRSQYATSLTVGYQF